MEQFYWAALGAAKGIDTARMLALVRSFGSAQNLYEAEEADILATGIISPECTARFVERNKKNRKLPEILQEQCDRLRISVVPVASPLYPERLKRILHPPVVLYVKGTLPDCRYSIGMVGSRMADAYGKKVATGFGKTLAEASVIIVSGGAAGIDTASHEGALQGGGKTVAVLGCGVDIVYPHTNAKLFAAIAEHGAIMSEYPPGTPPDRYRFPERNRIISGISQGVVLVQAAKRSGALITAEFAMDEGREVFCIPGNIFSDKSAGPHRLIKAGARLADSPQDILEEVFPELCGSAHSNLFAGLNDTTPLRKCTEGQQKLLDLLTQGPLTMEQMVVSSGFSIGEVSVMLLELQMMGFVEMNAAQQYVRI
ncbi:MAG: DNA-processing protein DprA [Acidaminococcaceae bacterium]|nr:DNA-processing protein DprA [Acidaminococcaceae bacterium]